MLTLTRRVKQGIIVRDENGHSWIAVRIKEVKGKKIVLEMMGTADRIFDRLNEDKDIPEELKQEVERLEQIGKQNGNGTKER